MKKIMLIIFSIFTLNMGAKDLEKTVTLKSHINKIKLDGQNTYRLDLREHAAVYHAHADTLPCLQKALNQNQLVTLTIEPYTLLIKKCEAN